MRLKDILKITLKDSKKSVSDLTPAQIVAMQEKLYRLINIVEDEVIKREGNYDEV